MSLRTPTGVAGEVRNWMISMIAHDSAADTEWGMKSVCGICLFLAPLVMQAATLTLAPPINVNRPWPGPEYWTNPAEDWVCRDGRIENTFSGSGRDVVVLTGEVGDQAGAFTLRARIDQTSFELKSDGFVGFQAGLRAPSGDFREAAVAGTGFSAGLNADGSMFIGGEHTVPHLANKPFRNLKLSLRAEPDRGDDYKLILSLTDPSGKQLGEVSTMCHRSWLPGLVALTASSEPAPAVRLKDPRPPSPPQFHRQRGGDICFRFDDIVLAGDKVHPRPERALGPILWTSQLLSNDGHIYLLMQAAPFGRQERMDATLYLDGEKSSSVTLDPASRTARFMIRKDVLKSGHEYEIRFAGGSWKGTVHPVPQDRPLVVASLSGDDGTDFPHVSLTGNVLSHRPDVLVFLGNQIQKETGGFGNLVDQHPNERAALCYLRKYYLHGWAWREALRDIPTVTLPGERDVFQTRLWGDGGTAADVAMGYGVRAQDGGGYMLSPELVNIVHTTQAGNLPPPVDPSPCGSGITVYFTDWAYGPLRFAVLNDMQFRTPAGRDLPEIRLVNGVPTKPAAFRGAAADPKGAQLFGTRQENFLARWAESRRAGEPFRVVLSRSPLVGMNVQPGVQGGEFPVPDFQAAAWPVRKRDLVVAALRDTRAVHLTGSLQLGASGRYLLPEAGDGPWFIAAPPVTNESPAGWPAKNHGSVSTDAFGNRFVVQAAAVAADGKAMTGYSITRWDAASGQVVAENWPSDAAPNLPPPHNKPFPGWPHTLVPGAGKGERTALHP